MSDMSGFRYTYREKQYDYSVFVHRSSPELEFETVYDIADNFRNTGNVTRWWLQFFQRCHFCFLKGS